MQTIPLKVLNTVTAQGTDCSVDTNGVAVIAGFSVDTKNIVDITKQASVAETKAGWTITPPDPSADSVFQLVISGYHISTGEPYYVPLTVYAVSADTATTVCDDFRSQLAVLTDLNVAASGTSTLILTATGVTSAGFSQLAQFQVDQGNLTTVDFTSITNTTPGVPAQGTVDVLKRKYSQQNLMTNLGYGSIADLTSGSTYTEYNVSYYRYSPGSPLHVGNLATITYVLLVKEGVTNFDDLCGTYGTLTGLKAGYATTISAATTVSNKAAAITVTTGVVTLSGSDSPTFASEDIRVDDVINIGGTSGTYTRNQSVLTQTTAVGTTIVAVAASAYRVIKYRPIPY